MAILEAENAEILVELPPDLVWFKGHFPDQPVLPVSRRFTWRRCGPSGFGRGSLWAGNLSHLKFRQIIRPNDKVRLKLVRDMTKQRLKFTYHLGTVVASEGTIGGSE